MKFYTSSRFGRSARIFCAFLMAAFMVPVIAFSQSPATVNLNSAGNFEILAAQTITSTGGGTIDGNIGIDPGSSITGFPPGFVNGSTDGPGPVTAQAQTDLTTAYNDAMGRTTNAITVAGNIGGQTLVPGLYKSTSSLAISSGNLTLDGQGNENAVWIFQIASTLTTTSGLNVILANGANPKNIFWAVGSSATLGTNTIFYGNILAHISITMNSTVQMVGRSLASTGSVTANGTGASNPDSVAAFNIPTFSTNSRNIKITSIPVDSSSWTLITIYDTGSATLNISAATSSNIVFSSKLSGTSVMPGDSIVDSIKFVPTAMGADSGKLIFTSNAASTPDTVLVSSKGLAAFFSTNSDSVKTGRVHIDSTSWTLITLRNTGNDTLRMGAITSTNPLFSSHLSSLIIAPGDSTTDSIKFNPTLIGADSGYLIFASNSLNAPDSIRVKGIGTEAILSTTSRIVNAGSTHVDSVSWTLITISNTGNDTLRFTGTTSTNPFFSSHLSGMTIAPGNTITDSIRFNPTTMGNDAGQLILTGNSITSPDTIAVSGIGIEAIFSAASHTVNVGATHVNTTSWTLVTLTNTGNDTLRFTRATSTNPVFASHLAGLFIAPGASIVDSIKFLPTAMGTDSGNLIFTSNAVSSPDTISVTGIGKEAILAINSRTVNCGTTLVGTPISTLVTLYNAGNDTLRFTAATSSNPEFTSQLSVSQIAPGASIVDLIVFLPTSPGMDSAQLIFLSNAPSSPDIIVASGIGVALARAAILDISSRVVNCGTTPAGTPTWTLVTLFNTGNDTLRFTSVASTNAIFSSHLSGTVIPPGTSIIDSIKFLPPNAGSDAGVLTFTGNAVNSPDSITVYGIGLNSLTKTAIFAASARDVDCGITNVGAHTWTLVTISNPGADTLFISASTSTNPVFASSLSQTAIAPGAEIIDLIVFQPTDVGEAAGYLIFTSNSITSPDSIGVYGNGTPSTSAVVEGAPLASYTLGTIYPNPVSSSAQLQIQLQTDERMYQAGLYDVLGHELEDWTSRFSPNQSLSINVGAYPSGMYYVRLLTSARMQVLPVVIAR